MRVHVLNLDWVARISFVRLVVGRSHSTDFELPTRPIPRETMRQVIYGGGQ